MVAGENDPGREPGALAGADAQIVWHGVRFDQGKFFLRQLRQFQIAGLCQRVIVGKYGHQFVLAEWQLHKLNILVGIMFQIKRAVPKECKVAFVIEQCFPNNHGIFFYRMYLNGGICRLKIEQGVCDIILRHSGNGGTP